MDGAFVNLSNPFNPWEKPLHNSTQKICQQSTYKIFEFHQYGIGMCGKNLITFQTLVIHPIHLIRGREFFGIPIQKKSASNKCGRLVKLFGNILLFIFQPYPVSFRLYKHLHQVFSCMLQMLLKFHQYLHRYVRPLV